MVPLWRAASLGLSGDHLQTVLTDRLFTTAVWNTGRYVLLSIFAVMPLALLLALLIRGCRAWLQPVLLFFLLLPGLTPPSVLGIVFYEAFHKSGLFNDLLAPLGISPNWLIDPRHIPIAMVFQCVWRWTGFMTFFLYCGLRALPDDLEEAAELDGAKRLQRLRHVVLPQLRPVVLFCVAYLVIDGVSLFAGAYTLLGASGGTAFSGMLLVTYAFREGSAAFGGAPEAASAAGLLILPILGILLGIIFSGASHRLRPVSRAFTLGVVLLVVWSFTSMRPGMAWPWLGLLAVPWLGLWLWGRMPRVLGTLVLPLGVTALAFPVVWMALASFKNNQQILEPWPILPETWSFQYVQRLLSGADLPFWTHFGNSLTVAAFQALLATFVSAAFGFALARSKGWWRWPLFVLGLLVVVLPRQGLAWPMVSWMQELHLHDTLAGLVLIGGASGIGMLYFSQVFRRFPDALLETARMEGAAEWRVFLTALRLVRPALFAYGLIHFILAWHEHLLPLLLIDTDAKRTLPVALSALFSSGLDFPKAVIMAACTLIVLPGAFLFILCFRALRDSMSDLASR